MAKKLHNTPNLDQLESGPWPSFVTGLKELAKEKDYVVDLLGQLEESYKTRKGYWKGGTVGVFGYGGGVIPRFTELKNEDGTPKFKDVAPFHQNFAISHVEHRLIRSFDFRFGVDKEIQVDPIPETRVSHDVPRLTDPQKVVIARLSLVATSAGAVENHGMTIVFDFKNLNDAL